MTTRIQTTARAPRQIGLGRIVNWLLEQDQRYREAQKLARMSARRLQDMGLSRDDADQGFRAKGRRG